MGKNEKKNDVFLICLGSFGTILGVFWDMFGTFLDSFGKCLVSFGNIFGTFVGKTCFFVRIKKYFGTRNIFNQSLWLIVLFKIRVTGGYQNKKIGRNRKGLTFLRAFKGKLKGHARKN